jgi:hypothetical protein
MKVNVNFAIAFCFHAPCYFGYGDFLTFNQVPTPFGPSSKHELTLVFALRI